MAASADTVRRIFQAALENDIETYVSYFTHDATYKGGNMPPVIGPDGIRAFAEPVKDIFYTVDHEILNMWEVGDTVIAQVEVLYHRKQDDKKFRIPTVNIIRFRDDKIRSLQAFGDPSPAFMP